MSLTEFLDESARRIPFDVALQVSDKSLTYLELADQVARLAHGLSTLGLGPQDCVGILLPNSTDLVTALLATWRAGMIATPLSPGFAPKQLDYILRHSGCRVLITTPKLLVSVSSSVREGLDAIVVNGEADGTIPLSRFLSGPAAPAYVHGPTDPDPIGILAYTSGTTSRPKGVAHTQKRMGRRIKSFVNVMELTADDSCLVIYNVARPVFLLSQLMAMLAVGGRTILLESDNTELFWKEYARVQPTYLVGPPGKTGDLVDDSIAVKTDHAKLRFWVVGGDKCPTALYRRMAEVVGKPLIEMCGMTEAGFYCITPPHGPFKSGSIGPSMPDVTIRLVDERGDEVPVGNVGRLYIRSPDVMIGYWNDTVRTHQMLQNEWLDTQDLMMIDRENYLWFMGRAKDLISCGGMKVSPAMVESSLLEHPSVAAAVVVGASDDRYGQVPVAFYKLRTEATDPSSEQLVDWLRTRVEALSIPTCFYRVKEFPATANGKVDRSRLVWMADAGGVEL